MYSTSIEQHYSPWRPPGCCCFNRASGKPVRIHSGNGICLSTKKAVFIRGSHKVKLMYGRNLHSSCGYRIVDGQSYGLQGLLALERLHLADSTRPVQIKLGAKVETLLPETSAGSRHQLHPQ